MSDADLDGKPAEFAMPDVLVRLAEAADVVLTIDGAEGESRAHNGQPGR